MPASVDEPTATLVRRIQCEFVEMPGLRVTPEQAQRLWGVDHHVCCAVLDALVMAKFLCRANDGRFMRQSFV
jgi:hypothetical protein